MRRVCIHQPDFLPWLGFFHRLLVSDVFVIHDDAQFLKRGWHHRDKIKTKQGVTWLTVPVQKDDYRSNINQILLSKEPGARFAKNLNLLREHYSEAPYFDEYFPRIKNIYLADFARLIDLNIAFLHLFFDLFDLKVNAILSSELSVAGHSSHKVRNLVEAVGGTHYLTGTGARAYLDERVFEDAGIVVEWQQFQQPVYPQLHGPFISNLSCIDVLFNCGPYAKDVLRSCVSAK